MFSFKEIIKAIVADPSQSLGQLLFQDFTSVNNVISGLKLDLISTLHELFTQRAILLPNAVAIESNDQKNYLCRIKQNDQSNGKLFVV
jgi:hypothetical protein